MTDPRYALAPLLTVELADPSVITSAVDNATFRASDSRLTSLLVSARGARTGQEWRSVLRSALDLEDQPAQSLFEHLLAAGLLREWVDPAADDGIDLWFERAWGHALSYHLSTRNLAFADVEPAAARPYRNLIEDGPPPDWFAEHPAPLERIPLPPAQPIESAEPFSSMILRRRTNRPWTDRPIRFEELGWLLSVTNAESTAARRRATRTWQDDPAVLLDVPFGAFESYLVIEKLDPLQQGLYHLNLARPSLDLIRAGQVLPEVLEICGNQQPLLGCRFAVLIFAQWQRQQFGYRHPRGYRNLFISAGEFAQSYLMAATALRYSAFMTPATRDDLAEQLLGQDRYQSNLLYIIGIG